MKCNFEGCEKENASFVPDAVRFWYCDKHMWKGEMTPEADEHCVTSVSDVTPETIMKEMAETFAERHKIYGDNYKQIGDVMTKLFPLGITLSSPNEHNSFSLFSMMVVKLTRLANSNLKHKDSVHDIGVYAAMLESLQ